MLNQFINAFGGPSTIQEIIQRDLSLLFNTRQGSLSHLPNYGLPDLQSIYHTFPEGKLKFINQIQKQVESYEPRLSKVRVSELIVSSSESFLNLNIDALLLKDGEVQFNSLFLRTGHVTVQ